MLKKGEVFAPSDSDYSDLPASVVEKRENNKIDFAIAFLKKHGFSFTTATDNEALANC